MSEFTYEAVNRETRLETYEWDNVWWEQANTTGISRVLYIGDSISCGTRIKATKVAENKILFDGFGTSKALDNPYFADSIRMFAKQQGERVAILFNNGLHGWHLYDETEYGVYYEKMLNFLLKEFKNTPLFLVLTTHVTNPERDARVAVRNRVVSDLAKKYHLPTIDFYTITKEHEDQLTDGVHLTGDGYDLLARKLVENVYKVIER